VVLNSNPNYAPHTEHTEARRLAAA